jgi:hypothetical protein
LALAGLYIGTMAYFANISFAGQRPEHADYFGYWALRWGALSVVSFICLACVVIALVRRRKARRENHTPA